jgi:cobalt-zinc-cadmium efflux system protein
VAFDALGSIGVMVAAGLVLAFDWQRADAVISVGIALLVAWGGWRVLRETTRILLEGAPPNLDVKAVEGAILHIVGVAEVHDLHVWRISDRFDALTVHVTLERGAHGVEVCREVAACLRNRFGLEHVTVQPEAPPPELVSLRRNKEGGPIEAPGSA